MPTSVAYLAPTTDAPAVIEIDGICYSLGPQTSAPPATSSYDDGSGCCPQNPAPCTCPGGLRGTYSLTADGLAPSPLPLNRVGTGCEWSGTDYGGNVFTITLGGTPPNCYWTLSAHQTGQNDASGSSNKAIGPERETGT
jgi:hypothetical protein